MASIYDTNVLVSVVQSLIRPQTFFLDRWFPGVVEYETEEVSIDVLLGKRRVSPFVSPLVEGKVVQGLGYNTKTFKPAYIKDKRVFDANAPLKRRAGERIGGDATPVDRAQANLAVELQDQVEMLTRRLELMALDALIDGVTTISGEGFATVTVDFGRDPSLTVTLTGTNRWGQTGISPTGNIETWQTQILKQSGATVTDIVFTPLSWNQFRIDPTVTTAINTFYAGTDAAVNQAPEVATGAVPVGRWGNYNLWLYNDWYIDPDDGVEKPMLPDGYVLMGGPQIQGAQHFGIIRDPGLNYPRGAYFPKSWVSEDPAVRFLLMQSAPLVVPTRVNATFAAKVL